MYPITRIDYSCQSFSVDTLHLLSKKHANWFPIIIFSSFKPKSSLLSTAGVDVTTNTIDNYTLISFAPDASGSSGSIQINGTVDADLSTLTINILSGSVSSGGTDLSSGSNIELGTDDLTAQADAENFVIDATYASSTISASDG